MWGIRGASPEEKEGCRGKDVQKKVLSMDEREGVTDDEGGESMEPTVLTMDR